MLRTSDDADTLCEINFYLGGNFRFCALNYDENLIFYLFYRGVKGVFSAPGIAEKTNLSYIQQPYERINDLRRLPIASQRRFGKVL